ncbi:hypothetical protein [Desulfofundulus kuznetsovii]
MLLYKEFSENGGESATGGTWRVKGVGGRVLESKRKRRRTVEKA